MNEEDGFFRMFRTIRPIFGVNLYLRPVRVSVSFWYWTVWIGGVN